VPPPVFEYGGSLPRWDNRGAEELGPVLGRHSQGCHGYGTDTTSTGLGHEAAEEGRGRGRVEDLPVAATAERAGQTVQDSDGEGVFYLGVFFLEGVFYLWGQGRGRERGGM
jgi:hypothetical protein